MDSRLPLALSLLAVACTPGGRAPARAPADVRVRVLATHVEGAKPETFVVRCHVDGAPGAVSYSWQLGGAVRLGGWGAPIDEDALLVTLHDPPNPAGSTVECRVTLLGFDGGAPSWTGWQSLAPLVVRQASGTDRVTVEGSGFGPARGVDDAVWLMPAHGATVALDLGCVGASWSDGKIVGCVPRGLAGPYQVRVESSGRLGLGPMWTAKR